MTLNLVLCVSDLSCNLFSIRKFTKNSQCEFQYLDSKRMIGNAREINGLYYFEDENLLARQAQVANQPSTEEIML